jgi:O-antigen/teichoic acid export membrane protein
LRVIEVVKWGLRLLFVVLALELGYGLGGIGMAYLGTGVLTLAVLYIFVFVRDPNLRINLRLSSRKSFRLLFGFSIWIFMAKIFAFISYRIDVILIGIFLAPVYLAYYSIAFKMYEALRLGLSIIPSALMPVAAELGAVADNRRLKQLFKKVSGYTVMFMYPLLLFTCFYAGDLIGAWVGTGFEVSTVLAQLFVASLFLHALASSGAEMMVGLGRVKELALYSGIASVVNLAVSILLIKAIGVYGVVIGTLIGTCILVAGRLYMLLPSFKVSVYEFSSDILLRQVAGSAVLAFVFYLGSGLLYVGALALAVYIIFTIAFMMDKDDKRELMKVLDLGGRTL